MKGGYNMSFTFEEYKLDLKSLRIIARDTIRCLKRAKNNRYSQVSLTMICRLQDGLRMNRLLQHVYMAAIASLA